MLKNNNFVNKLKFNLTQNNKQSKNKNKNTNNEFSYTMTNEGKKYSKTNHTFNML